jgi:hypothetical protein
MMRGSVGPLIREAQAQVKHNKEINFIVPEINRTRQKLTCSIKREMSFLGKFHHWQFHFE